jgi:hypothetical protein
MNKALPGRRIEAIEVLQPKCLNVPVEAFRAAITQREQPLSARVSATI